MQFTRKGDYALRAMSYMAENKSQRPQTIDQIAENSRVPRHFLAKILKDLTQARLLVAAKGAKGGYVLSRRPSQISLLQVMEAAVGPMALNICLEGDDRCPETPTCAYFPIWQKASRAFRGVFDHTMLSSVRSQKHS